VEENKKDETTSREWFSGTPEPIEMKKGAKES
jgi:hypothetical protein